MLNKMNDCLPISDGYEIVFFAVGTHGVDITIKGEMEDVLGRRTEYNLGKNFTTGLVSYNNKQCVCCLEKCTCSVKGTTTDFIHALDIIEKAEINNRQCK